MTHPESSNELVQLRMDAYYYSFGSTGVPEIDLILSAVACAGKAFHHTEAWNDECEWEPHEGNCPVDWIYNAAVKAAEALKAARTAPPPRDDRLEQAERLLRLSWGVCHNENRHELAAQIDAWLTPTKGAV